MTKVAKSCRSVPFVGVVGVTVHVNLKKFMGAGMRLGGEPKAEVSVWYQPRRGDVTLLSRDGKRFLLWCSPLQ